MTIHEVFINKICNIHPENNRYLMTRNGWQNCFGMATRWILFELIAWAIRAADSFFERYSPRLFRWPIVLSNGCLFQSNSWWTANFQEHFRVRGHTCLCFCFLGFNECLNYNGHCQQICNDTKTSYFCSCLPGYEVDKKDPKGCQGKWTLIVVHCQAA